MRIDVFLWRARLFKTRAAASAAVSGGARIERDNQVRRIDKPATPVGIGDLVSFGAPGGPRIVRILALPLRRGPHAEATLCYESLASAPTGPTPGSFIA
jgi:ribosome-associated heat shock protein Hsp15